MASGWMRPIGQALRGVRAGAHGLACHRAWLRDVPECIAVSSTAFGRGTDIPARYTADGAGLSPPLAWDGLPPRTQSVVILVEDADAPLLLPLVHLIAYGLPAGVQLEEGVVQAGRQQVVAAAVGVGRNSFGHSRWLPCAPPPGHGPHHYAFQVFALARTPQFPRPPGRSALLDQMRGQVLGRGVLFGLYERA